MKKIVIIGPESTGKSTLCAELADHFHTAWVPEFARQYLLTHGTSYTFDDLLVIAKAQVALEEDHIRSIKQKQETTSNLPFTIHHSPLFIDTDMYVMKVWCEFVFQQCHQWILNRIVERNYDLYLLCNIDLPWVQDELREYPDLQSRSTLYHMYRDIMVNQAVPWMDISGDYNQRLKQAIDGVNKYV